MALTNNSKVTSWTMASDESSSSDEARHAKRSRHEKKEKKKHKDKDKKKDKDEDKRHKKHHQRDSTGQAAGAAAVPTQLSEDDYFNRSREFQKWLASARGTFLDEITTVEAKKLFAKFVTKWNAGELAQDVYDASGGGGGGSQAANRTDSAHVEFCVEAKRR